MKQDIIDQFHADMKAAADAAEDKFYESAKADGVASVPAGGGTGISQADLDKAVSDAKAAMQSDLDAVKAQLAGDEQALADHAALEASMQSKLDKIKELLG